MNTRVTARTETGGKGTLRARAAARAALLASSLLAAACGAPGEEDPAAGAAGTQGEITGGTVILPSNNGIIRLQVWTTTYNDYWTTCSGVLMSNGTALTAKHCLTDPSVAGRTIYARMGGQIKAVTGWVGHPTLDVAVVRFDPMLMYKWSFDHYVQAPPFTDRTTYRRAIYTGSNASLNGQLLRCAGWGPGGLNSQLQVADLLAEYSNITFGSVFLYSYNGASQASGDSGMGCTLGSQAYAPIAYIHEGSWWGDGAESWRGWFGY